MSDLRGKAENDHNEKIANSMRIGYKERVLTHVYVFVVRATQSSVNIITHKYDHVSFFHQSTDCSTSLLYCAHKHTLTFTKSHNFSEKRNE